jgi:O-antigen ligase
LILLLFTSIYIKNFAKKHLLPLAVIVFFIGITCSSFIKSDEKTIFDLIRENSISNRIEMYKMSLELIKEKPIFGHTPAVAARPLYDMLLSMNGPTNKIEHFHNIYLNTLVDFGIVGFILFIFIFYALFCRLIKKYKETKSSYVLMLFFAWIAVLISDCFDAFLINPFCSGLFFWITGIVLSEQKKSEKIN